MALSLLIESAVAQEALAVPLSAIVDEDGRAVVFVQLAGETFGKKYPELGVRDADRVQVVDGVDSNDRIVTQGAYAIRLASVSTSIPAHGHSH
jgi:hypothetical protein